MLRFHKTRDIITLFHNPSKAASQRVLNLVKATSAAASETATEDQASDHTAQNQQQRSDFDLDVSEQPPTQDQMQTILEYLGPRGPGALFKGANTTSEALQKLKQNAESMERPLLVDWNQGKAVVGENESAILKLLKTGPQGGKQ